jgi:hypothetical protein
MNVAMHAEQPTVRCGHGSGWSWMRAAGSLAALAAVLLTSTAAAQERLLSTGTSSAGMVYESWHFGNDGFTQPIGTGAYSVRIKSVSQLSVPVAATVSLGDRLTVDVATAYATGRVTLAAPDTALGGTSTYTLSGMSDVRLRASGRVVGDNLLVTLGVNVPTGATSLDAREFGALRVLAAPALGLQTPVLGTGTGATAGLVYARELNGWAWALGTSYEMRSSYAPVTVAGGVAAPDFSPGNALHLSLGADGFVGQNGLTMGVSADFYGESELRLPAQTIGGPGIQGAAGAPATSQLGPIFTANAQFRVAARSFRELTVYAVDHYRTSYKQGGVEASGSSGNYFDAGVRGVLATTSATGVLMALDVRHQTGLSVDNTLATAAMRSGAITIGLVRALPRGYALRPFVRGQLGRITSGDTSSTATSLAGGLMLDVRF